MSMLHTAASTWSDSGRCRVRRLLPASLLCVGVVVALRLGGLFDDAPHLGRDAIGATAQVANWVELGGGITYAEQIAGGRGPLDHYWSLAIEEQFYWCWPLLMVVVLATRRPVIALFGLAAATVATAPAIAWRFGPDAAYWATPARIGEIVVGAALAGLVHERTATTRLGMLGPPAAIAILICATTWPANSGPAYRGWLPVFALASAALIASTLVPGPIQRLCSTGSLVRLGEISYGVYLAHWPIFLLIGVRAEPDVATFAFAVALTIAVAMLSHRFVEAPIRYGTSPRMQVWTVAPLASAALIVAAIALPISSPDPFAHPELAAGQLRLAIAPAPAIPLAQPVALSPRARRSPNSGPRHAPPFPISRRPRCQRRRPPRGRPAHRTTRHRSSWHRGYRSHRRARSGSCSSATRSPGASAMGWSPGPTLTLDTPRSAS